MDDKKAKVENMLAMLGDKFVRELPTKIADIEQFVLTMESQGVDDETADLMYREVHSLKGSAGSHGLGVLSDISHAIEEQLEAVRSPSADAVDTYTSEMLRLLDLMTAAIDIINSGGDDFSPIEAGIASAGTQEAASKESNVVEEALETPPPVAPVEGPKARVLIVDSAHTVLALTQKILGGLPLECIAETDPLAALERLAEQSFDYVICEEDPGTISGKGLFAATKISGGENWNICSILLGERSDVESEGDEFVDHVVENNDEWMNNLLQQMTVLVGR